MRYIRITILLVAISFISTLSFAQTTIYKRSAVIPPRPADPEGYGNIISGDVTGSGAPQIYAVSGELNNSGIIPRIYEFKWNGTKWDSVWGSVPGLTDQNTWCPLAIADLDGDGRKEIVWGPINAALSASNPNPMRLIDYEADGSGGDALGVSDGSGGYNPNATWTMTDSSEYNTRPFVWVAADVNNDGKQELIFTTRAGGYHFGVISVDNIPDNGDGSEQWNLDTSGIGGGTGSFSFPDLAVIDSTIYMFNYSTGDMQPIYYANGKYTFGEIYTAVAPGGTWKTAQVVDLDNSGHKEILIGSVNNGKVYLLQPAGDSLSTTEIADFGSLGCNRLNGSALGDFNGDGYMDIAFGSRSTYSTPDASIYVLYYKGGDITSPSSYQTALADSELAAGDQWDMLTADTVSTPHQIVYSGIDRSGIAAPIGVLSSMKVDSLITITEAVKDADNNYVPDDSGATVKVIGVINSANDQGTNYCSYSMQDGGAGIKLFGNSSFGTDFNFGDRVLVTGTVIQYNGLNEISPTSVTLLDSERVLNPMKTTLEDLSMNSEMYESMLVELDGVGKTASSGAWPSSASSNASMEIWDGYDSLSMFIDKDTQLGANAEPVWPVNLQGVMAQYTKSVPANDGYEIHPSFYSQFTQNVAVLPSKYFSLQTPADSMVVSITDSLQKVNFSWMDAIDLNGDAIKYQLLLLPSLYTSGALDNAMMDLDAKTILDGMTSDTMTVRWTVKAKGAETDFTSSVDTFMVTFINDIVVGVNDKYVPTHFYVDQNYPNPFNPTTTIKFGLEKQQNVDLRIYNVLGQQVAVLINNQVRAAGSYNEHFNASNLASGTYIYRLTAGNNIVTKKMILLK